MPAPANPQIDLAAAMQLFDTEVTLKYQNHLRLEDTIDERHGTTGTILNVPVSDLVEMTMGNFAPVDIPPTPVNETNIQVVTNDYHLKTVIGGGEKTLFNFDKITDHAKLHALAGARLTDFIKISAIYSNAGVATIYTVPVTVGVNTGINEGKMADALSYLESQGVDVMDYSVSMWAPALLKKSLYGDDKVVNFFYVDHKPLTDNRIRTYLDVDCRFLGSNGINQIPLVSIGGGTNQYLVPLVHKDAIVQSFNRDMLTSITWLQHQDRWELLSILTSGANVIQLNGIAFMTANNPFVSN
jgi:hypothetical protein